MKCVKHENIRGLEASNRAEWLLFRKNFIGGSDVAKIFDLSPWECSLEYFNKCCGISNKINLESNTAAKTGGKIYEPFVQLQFIAYCKNYMGIDINVVDNEEDFYNMDNVIYNDPRYYCHSDYPFMGAEVDALVRLDGKTYVLEYKTTGNESMKQQHTIKNYKNGIPPQYYVTQCRHYTAVMDTDGAILCCCWGFKSDSNSMAVIFIGRDLDYEKAMIEGEEKFWTAVQDLDDWSPDLCNGALLKKYYTNFYGEVKEYEAPAEIPCEYYEKFMEYSNRKKTIAELSASIAELKNLNDIFEAEIIDIAKDNNKAVCKDADGEHPIWVDLKTPTDKSNSGGRVTKIANHILETRTGFNYNLFETEHPDLFKKFTVEVLDCATLKEENPALFRKFLIPPTAKPNGDANEVKISTTSPTTEVEQKTKEKPKRGKKKKADADSSTSTEANS